MYFHTIKKRLIGNIFVQNGSPASVWKPEESSPEGVPGDKNTGLNDGDRSGLNKKIYFKSCVKSKDKINETV